MYAFDINHIQFILGVMCYFTLFSYCMLYFINALQFIIKFCFKKLLFIIDKNTMICVAMSFFLIVPSTQVQNSLRGIPRSEILYCMQTLHLSR